MAADNKKGIVGIFILVLVFFVIFMIFAAYTLKSLHGDFGQPGFITSIDSKEAPIAVVEVDGTILQSKNVIRKLHMAEENKKVKAIIVRVNSPGGAVGPTQEIYEEMRRIDKKKPVYASFGSIAASGGYYIGAAARKIYANAGTLTGSIGVIMHFLNLKKLYEFAKVKPQVIKAGKYKDIGSPMRDFTLEERQLMEKMIAGVHEQFRIDILNTRKKKLKRPLIELAQGQIFSGSEAKATGLVDEIAGLWAAGRKIHKELKLKEKFGLQYIKLTKKFNLNDLFTDIEESVAELKYGTMNPIPLLIFSPN